MNKSMTNQAMTIHLHRLESVNNTHEKHSVHKTQRNLTRIHRVAVTVRQKP